jgi:hypothetical protein
MSLHEIGPNNKMNEQLTTEQDRQLVLDLLTANTDSDRIYVYRQHGMEDKAIEVAAQSLVKQASQLGGFYDYTYPMLWEMLYGNDFMKAAIALARSMQQGDNE